MRNVETYANAAVGSAARAAVQAYFTEGHGWRRMHEGEFGRQGLVDAAKTRFTRFEWARPSV